MFHGRIGQLRHGYRDGWRPARRARTDPQHDHLWNTIYLDHAIGQLRTTGYPVVDADVARSSPYMRRDISFHGHYSFAPTNLAGERRA